MNDHCQRCNGLLVPDNITDFYTELQIMKCLSCGRVTDIGKKSYAFRPVEKVRT